MNFKPFRMMIFTLWVLYTPTIFAEEKVKSVDGIFDEIRESDTASIGHLLRSLKEKSSSPFYDEIERIDELAPRKQIGCAEVLCYRGDLAGLKLLLKILKRSSEPPIQIEALRVLGNYGLIGSHLETKTDFQVDLLSYLRSSLTGCKQPQLKIALARTLWRFGLQEDERISAIESLNEVFLSDVAAERLEAAFALAELSGASALPSNVIRLLKLIENEAGADGIRAKQILEKHRLILHMTADDRFYGRLGQPLLDEMVRKVGKFYVDEKYTNPAYLVESGARGIAGGLDRFSSYMGVKQWKDFQEGMSGTYAGIGAVLRQRGESVYIEKVFFNGPAYQAGIRSYDEIVGIVEEGNGETEETKDILKKIRGKPDSKMSLRVRRVLSANDLKIEVIRKNIRIPAVHTARLPGGIAYIILNSFGNDSDEDFKQNLDELELAGEVSGLIIDLRNNPGGLINAAQGIAGLFLDDNELIVYSEGRNAEIAPRREYRVLRGQDEANTDNQRRNSKREYPLVVLMNGQSASASEIVSGALQDHKRAKLIGERSYGKGSVQQVMPLDSTKGASALKLTVAKYYLPSGRSIHEVGLQPDFVVKDLKGPEEKFDQEKTWSHKPFVKYVLNNMEEHLALFEKLAWFDNQDGKNYPSFEEFYSSLNTAAPRQYVRYKLRHCLRRMLSDRHGKEFMVDIVEDAVLKQGIKTVCKMAGIKIVSFPEYSLLDGPGGGE